MQPLDNPLTGSPRLHLLGGARPNRASTWKNPSRPCLQPPSGGLRVYHGSGRPLAAHQQKYPNNPDHDERERERERAERDEEKRRGRERKKQERGIRRSRTEAQRSRTEARSLSGAPVVSSRV
jgi:hypothetical protein